MVTKKQFGPSEIRKKGNPQPRPHDLLKPIQTALQKTADWLLYNWHTELIQTYEVQRP